ncbi:hypothetical protein CYLTODRAFT_435084 [Cylindrobasidium torrendii FP15055 ss-10]|uniref:Uncharacterized protein n=1 Tax=Cylindrobasidium torrendii FP15055 ss-10 TaxID=1314674 RepID=A0A0D7BQ20_9AGAR|nr:hypothetical protein CYLTODRAFT_435084 [Cylindrobasidium torrendii FP15055 ss-10]
MEVGVGAKHWSDEEKTRLFNWLMGPGQDDHWNALRATKNSCLRDCSIQVFGNKKTYQALKGCYERNFNLFKQIYALEAWCHQSGNAAPMDGLSETERLKEYERRLNSARKVGCDVGSIIPRTVDNWHQLGWYRLFYTRWHGDPATTKPVQHRQSMAPPSGGDSHDVDLDDNGMDYNDPNLQALANSHEPISFVHAPPAPPPPPPPQIHHNHSQPSHQPLPPQVHSLAPSHSHSAPPHSQPPSSLTQLPPPPPPPPMHHTMPMSPGFAPQTPFSPEGHGLMMPPPAVNALMQYLQTKTLTAKSKLDYLRRREEREERDSQRRKETERLDSDRKKAELDFNIQVAQQKEKTDRAIEILQNQSMDPSIKAAAGEYLKKMFSND